ncbi:MAG TPA: energy transducer TonB [Vicinamibacterales bacterium]|nr:energy transducer TonB [Vicinamibacterales bacterium]
MKSLLMVSLALVVAPASLRAQDTLSTAKDLYASAAYEDALATLGRLDGATSADVSRQIDEYRAFCLFALGRTDEAESVAEALVRRQPLATLDTADTSPRLERMFSDVRKRLLPSLIREQFRTARSEIDRKNFSTAEPPLTEARLMIAEAQRLGVKDDGLGDLSVLVEGFLQLIRSSAELRPAPKVEALATAAVTATAALPPVAAPPPAVPAAPARSASAAASAAAVYTIADEGVSPPITIDQRVPAMDPQLQTIARSTKKSGMFDIVIDESGRVVETTVRRSLNASFDSLVVRTATRWRYQPARKDGVPVKFVKTIVLVP